jgi:WhiB family redox-sensing transcriptional regulator
MEKQQHSPERAKQTSLSEAQQAAEWLADYLYGDGEPAAVLPATTEERLSDLFQDDTVTTWLGRFKHVFTQLESEQQAVAGLYVAGYPPAAIEALAEVSVADMLTTVRHQVRVRGQQKPSLNGAKSPQAYIPLKMVADHLREPAPIDEVKLKEACHAINELEPAVFAERLRQVPQYLPSPTKDTWLRIVTEWLDGQGVSELAVTHGLGEYAIAAQLTRVGKVFLKQYSTERVYRTLTRDDLEWQTQALCAQVGGDYFFPEKGEPTSDAKKICAACEVRAQCDDYAKHTGHAFGVFAGKSVAAHNKEKKA